eukprot:TRINITY_DN11688_c0_g1_i1.p1 TRINITY_DN11688_c0_g1~~TRINITY_DN11688_c0_g1_i1.p1  ORF type:complete len:1082 (+),score=452.94 TRINITY_DN11688_c0_g1_i1:110-3355(+)
MAQPLLRDVYVPFRLAATKNETKAKFTCLAAGKLGEPARPFLFCGTDDGWVHAYVREGWHEVEQLDLEDGWDTRLAATQAQPLRHLKVPHQVDKRQRPVAQLCVDEELKRIFALADGSVVMLKLEREEIQQVTPLYGEKNHQITKVTAMCVGQLNGESYLVVALKKRVHVFWFTRDAIHTTGERTQTIPLESQTDSVRLTLVDNVLVLATKQDYRLLNLAEGGGSRTVDTRGAPGLPIVLPFSVDGDTKLLVQSSKTSYVYDVATMQEEDRLTVWRDPPKWMAFVKPFHFIAATGDGAVEVVSYFRSEESDDAYLNPGRGPLREKIAGSVEAGNSLMKGANKIIGIAAAAGLGAMVSAGAIYEVMPTPFLGQLLRMAQSGSPGTADVDTALMLLRNHQPSLIDDEEKIECVLSREAGIAKFNAGDFQNAFILLERMHEVDPGHLDARCLIQSYDWGSTARDTRASVLERYMYVSDLPPLTQLQKVDEIIGERVAEDADASASGLLDEAKYELYCFLKLVRVLHHDPFEEVPDLHRSIDTALLLLYLDIAHKVGDGGVWDILQAGNCLEFDVCKDELEREGKIRCLALLKAHHGEVEEALRMLKELDEEHGDDGVQEMVLALQHCSDEENHLVLEYLPWVLNKDPDEAMKALLIPRVQPLDPKEVMRLLEPYPDDIVMQYLEYIIAHEDNAERAYHTQLALIYISAVKKLLPHCPSFSAIEGGREAGLLGQMRISLQQHLRFKKYYEPVRCLYDPITVAAHLHGSGLLQELVIVHSYMGDHEAAISLVLYEQRDLPAAVTYCVEQYERSLKEHLVSIFRKVFAKDEWGARHGSRSPTGRPQSPRSPTGRPGVSAFEDPAADGPDDGGVGDEEQFLEHAVARPDEFFSKYAGALKDIDVVGDKHGNVFTGIRKHNTYLMELIKQCMYPPGGREPLHRPDVIQLLEEHSKSLDPQLVLKIITQGDGGKMQLAELQRYIQQVFLRMASERREVVILKEISNANLQQHAVNRTELLNRHVRIDHDRKCFICKSNLGIGSVIVVFPNLKVAHNLCAEGSYGKDPVTGEPFWADMHHVRPSKKFYGAK